MKPNKDYLNSNKEDFKSDLHFLVRKYSSEHGILELQSLSLNKNVIIQFLSVNYMELPKILYGLKIYVADNEITANTKKKYIVENLSGFIVFILESNSKKYIVSALNYTINSSI